jgi:hypothetical protein
MKLIDLFEDNVTTIGIIFGRFNPPHKGHRAAWEMASANDFWFIGTNQSTEGPKDPLPFDVKVRAMTTIWPEAAGHIVAETSWLTLASAVHKKHNHNGNAVLRLYTDEKWVTDLVNRYNGTEGKHGFYNFQNIESISTPRLSSATALRQAVLQGDRQAFAAAAGVSADTNIDGEPFFALVRKYLKPYADAGKIKESVQHLDKRQGAKAVRMYQRMIADARNFARDHQSIVATIAETLGIANSAQIDQWLTEQNLIPENKDKKTPWERMSRAHKQKTGRSLEDVDAEIRRIQAVLHDLGKQYQSIIDKEKNNGSVDK